jgi:hypothetical protein
MSALGDGGDALMLGGLLLGVMIVGAVAGVWLDERRTIKTARGRRVRSFLRAHPFDEAHHNQRFWAILLYATIFTAFVGFVFTAAHPGV